MAFGQDRDNEPNGSEVSGWGRTLISQLDLRSRGEPSLGSVSMAVISDLATVFVAFIGPHVVVDLRSISAAGDGAGPEAISLVRRPRNSLRRHDPHVSSGHDPIVQRCVSDASISGPSAAAAGKVEKDFERNDVSNASAITPISSPVCHVSSGFHAHGTERLCRGVQR